MESEDEHISSFAFKASLACFLREVSFPQKVSAHAFCQKCGAKKATSC